MVFCGLSYRSQSNSPNLLALVSPPPKPQKIFSKVGKVKPKLDVTQKIRSPIKGPKSPLKLQIKPTSPVKQAAKLIAMKAKRTALYKPPWKSPERQPVAPPGRRKVGFCIVFLYPQSAFSEGVQLSQLLLFP